MIAQETISKVLDAASIVEVVSEFVRLKKSAANWKGLSPFTNEKTPSFVVSDVKNIFKCFSSGKGGSVVDFVMEMERVSYPEAIKWLAKKYNIEVVESHGANREKYDEAANELLQRQETYRREFAQSAGYAYMRSRGFTDELLEKFGVGFCDDQKVVKDEMRGRVTFPICNLNGRIIAFGGRILVSSDHAPKYINGKESELYHKSRTLFNMHRAKHEAAKQNKMYLVEGYTDVMAMDMHGVTNVVATCGTSLTEEQCHLILKFCDTVVIVYDGDSAGIKAAMRGIEIALQAGLNVNLKFLPDGDDPFDFLMKKSDQFADVPEQDFVTWRIAQLGEHAKRNPSEVGKIIQSICYTISFVSSTITRELYFRKVCLEFGVPRDKLVYYSNDAVVENKPEPKEYAADEDQLIYALVHRWNDPIVINVNGIPVQCSVAQYVIENFRDDELRFGSADNNSMFDELCAMYDDQVTDVSSVASRLAQCDVQGHFAQFMDADELKKYIIDLVMKVKLKSVNEMIADCDQQMMSSTDDESLFAQLELKHKYIQVRSVIAGYFGMAMC